MSITFKKKRYRDRVIKDGHTDSIAKLEADGWVSSKSKKTRKKKK
tara:strand:- start:11 stop:145 length:135 start_codon:yes stop_codon:yes gene_type:complete